MMLWAILFFLLSVVAGMLAFSGIAIAITLYSKVLFFIAILCFMLFLILLLLRRARDGKKDVT